LRPLAFVVSRATRKHLGSSKRREPVKEREEKKGLRCHEYCEMMLSYDCEEREERKVMRKKGKGKGRALHLGVSKEVWGRNATCLRCSEPRNRKVASGREEEGGGAVLQEETIE
jgi:hypothetical protein